MSGISAGKRLRVINLAGGPGIGKSTTAAGVFNLLKRADIACELVLEVAKDLTYEENWRKRGNSLVVFAEQEHKLRMLRSAGVEMVVTDSPLFLSLAYRHPEMPATFPLLVMETLAQYDNDFFLLDRVKPYQTYGRDQSEEEARKLDHAIRLHTHAAAKFCGKPMSVHSVAGDDWAADYIVEQVAPGALARVMRHMAEVEGRWADDGGPVHG